ncbi:MAG: TRAM domain-containing protein, partial [Firmicutes bacterium]|nr:TRAM domain-containing protein [Bacillota bacterium]
MGRAGEQIELYITDVSTQGEGIGKAGGLAVFAAGALPGDRVLAEIAEDKGRFAKAQVLEILEASADRVDPDCPNAGNCGGCALRCLKYEAQLQWKENFVRGALQRIGGFAEPPVQPIRGMEHP